MSELICGIAELVTNDDERRGLNDAAVVVKDGRIAWVGTADEAPAADRRRDLEGRAVVPGFVDTHTHLVFAGDRASEFAARMAGERYDGGGINSTVDATRSAGEDVLRAGRARRVAGLRGPGTAAGGGKSGYGPAGGPQRRAAPPAPGG